jgi:UDP-N-acetyl-D-mannosaminuronate dehydrogenase
MIKKMILKQNKKNSISVIGAAGHIGLPLSFLLAKHKFNVIGVEKDLRKIDMIKKKKNAF